jgi:hypothetical protein
MLQSQKIFSSLSAVWTIEPSRSEDHLSLFHTSGRRAIPSGLQTDQASSVRTTCLSVRTLHCVKKVLSSLHPSGRFSSTSRRLSVLDHFKISFQVPRKGRSINRLDNVVSRLNARLLQERIVNSNITVRTSDSCGPDEHSTKKEIADSTSTVRTTAYHGPDARKQIWKLCVEE